MQTIELTGSAIHGVGHYKVSTANLPTRVCLGRIKPKAKPSCLKLSSYIDAQTMGALPASTNWREKAGASIARVYLNDRYGDCVFASKAHGYGVWSANDSDSGGIVLATDAEIQQQYFAYTGGADNGANISEVLDYCKSPGFTLGGKKYKIDGYVSVDNTKKDLIKAALLIFGGLCIGIDLPSAWTNSAVWDVTNSGNVGGHDVLLIDYDDTGIYLSSWGRIYRMTWPAAMSTKWITEMYAMLAPLWYNADSIAPCGLKVDVLREDLTKIDGGIIPDIAPPAPPIPTPNAPYQVTFGNDLPAGPFTVISGGVTIQANVSTTRPAGTYLLTKIDPLPPH